MGCFGSAQHGGTAEGKAGGGGSDDSKSQKRRSDAITRQLQKDKQVTFNYKKLVGNPIISYLFI